MPTRLRRSRKTAAIREHDLSDFPASFESPESSNIVRATYDAVTETLKVTFRRDEMPVYVVQTFPISKWVEFYQADSKGKHYAAHIRPFYVGRREML